jgi:hypothetical protein
MKCYGFPEAGRVWRKDGRLAGERAARPGGAEVSAPSLDQPLGLRQVKEHLARQFAARLAEAMPFYRGGWRFFDPAKFRACDVARWRSIWRRGAGAGRAGSRVSAPCNDWAEVSC